MVKSFLGTKATCLKWVGGEGIVVLKVWRDDPISGFATLMHLDADSARKLIKEIEHNLAEVGEGSPNGGCP